MKWIKKILDKEQPPEKKFKAGDEIYKMTSYGWIYTGTVKRIDGNDMHIEFYSPTGNGPAYEVRDINDTDWEKLKT